MGYMKNEITTINETRQFLKLKNDMRDLTLGDSVDSNVPLFQSELPTGSKSRISLASLISSNTSAKCFLHVFLTIS